MPQVIDELVTILGFDMDSRAGTVLNKFNDGIDTVTRYANNASIAIVAASAAISYFTLQLNKASDEVEKLGRVTGISTDTIQEMSFAMEQVGGSAATMNSDLVSLMMSMNSPIPGEFNQGLFLLGISTKKASGELKSVDEVLLDIADKMQGMTKQKQMQWGKKIGISKDTIMLLQEGRGEIERLRKQAAQMPVIIDPESLKNAREFNRQISLLSRIFGFLGQTIASTAGPAFKDLVTSFAEWTSKNKEMISLGLLAFINGVADGFKRFSDVLVVVFDVVIDLIPGLDGLTESFTAVEVISGLVLGILTALIIPLAALAVKFLLIGGIVAAVGLIFEDLVVHLRGGESAIGELIKKITEMWEVFGQKFPAMADFLEEFWGVLKSFASFLKDVFFYVLDRFIEMLGLVAKGWGLLADLAEKGLKKLGFGDEAQVMEVKIKEVVETVRPFVDKGREKIQEVIEPVAPILEKARDKVFQKIQQVVEPIQETIEPVRKPIQAVQEKARVAQEPVRMIQRTIEETVKTIRESKEPAQNNDVSIASNIIGNFGAHVKEADGAINGFIQMVTGSIGLVKTELSKLNLADINISSPIATVQQNSAQPIEQNVTNTVRINITGDNAPAVASEVSSRLETMLYQIYPGGLAPAVQ